MANTAAPDSTRNLHTCTLLQDAAQCRGVLQGKHRRMALHSQCLQRPGSKEHPSLQDLGNQPCPAEGCPAQHLTQHVKSNHFSQVTGATESCLSPKTKFPYRSPVILPFCNPLHLGTFIKAQKIQQLINTETHSQIFLTSCLFQST